MVQEHCDNIFDGRAGPGAWGEAFVRLDEFANVHSSEDSAAHGAKEGHLLLLPPDGEGQGLDELSLFVYIVGPGVGGR